MARSISIAIAALITATQPALAQNDPPFYAGKRITLLVNFAPGGPSDIEGRLLARHVGKHIPGNPTVIVQNMDGAGGQVGTNYLGEVAPRDGTMVGYDLDLIWRVSEAVSVPVVASGGAGTYEHLYQGIKAGASAVAAGAMYQFSDATPKGASQYLANKGIEVRL